MLQDRPTRFRELRHRRRRAAALAIAVFGLPALSSCVAAVAAGGVTGGYTLTQERGFEGTIHDSALKAAVTHELASLNPEMAENLDVVVYEGRVLVTGRVPDPALREQAIKQVWQNKGAKEVYDEIEIGPYRSARSDMDDTWISTQLRNDLVWDTDVRSVNYIVTTDDHTVYLMGSARNQTELDRVTGYAREIPGVRRVVSFVKIRPGEPQRPAAAPASSPPNPGTAPPAAPNGAPPPGPPPAGSGDSIEVRPLQ